MAAERTRPTFAKLGRHIVEFTNEHGYPPSSREMAEHFGVSHSSIVRALTEMQTEGLLRRAPGIGRSVSVTTDGMKFLTPEELDRDG